VIHRSVETTLPKASGERSPSIASGNTAAATKSTDPAHSAEKPVCIVYIAVSTTISVSAAAGFL